VKEENKSTLTTIDPKNNNKSNENNKLKK